MPCSQAVSTRFQRDSVSWTMLAASGETASLKASSVRMRRFEPREKSSWKNVTGTGAPLTLWKASST